MRIEAPLIAEAVQAGQFVHVRVPGIEAHVLRRPFSVFGCDAAAGTIDVLYQVVGTGTGRMAELEAGDILDLIGALGRPWAPPEDARRALLVGGGVGAAALHLLAESLVGGGVTVDVVLGARTEGALVCRRYFEEMIGHEVRCATDDGSYGRAGFCTSLVEEALDQAREAEMPYGYVAVCGPEPLMHIVAGMAAAADVACEVSMERRMACGVGACLSCVVDTVSGRKRACADGPVFDAEEVVW